MWKTDFYNIAKAIPILCFALQSHINVPIIMSSKPNAKPWGIILRAYSIVCALYIPVGFFGYILFRRLVEAKSGFPGDVLNGFAITNTLADVARVCMMAQQSSRTPSTTFQVDPRHSILFRIAAMACHCRTFACTMWTASAALRTPYQNRGRVWVMGATVASSVMFIIPGFLV